MGKQAADIHYTGQDAWQLYTDVQSLFEHKTQVVLSGITRDVFLSYELLWKLLGKQYGVQVLILTGDEKIIHLAQQHGITARRHQKSSVQKKTIMQNNLSSGQFVVWSLKRFLGPLFEQIQSFEFRRIPRTFFGFWLFLLGALMSCFLIMSLVISLVHVETVITVTPSQYLKTLRQNFIFLENGSADVDRGVDVEPFIKNFQLSYELPVRNIDTSTLSIGSGKAKIENIEPDGFNLRANTVFSTEEGTLFKSVSQVYVPPGSPEEPGSVEVDLIGLERNSEGMFQGETSNIPFDTELTIPALVGQDDYLTIWSLNDFVGGSDDIRLLLTQQEYDRLVEIFTQKITLEAERSVIQELGNALRSDGYMPLPIPGHTQVITLNIQAFSDPGQRDAAEIGGHQDAVYFNGQGTFKTMLYNSADLDRHFLGYAKDRLLKGREVLASYGEMPVEFISVQEQREDPFYLRSTVQSQVALKYRIQDNDSGLRDELGEVLGLSRSDAKRHLLNNPFVQSIHIKNTPFWKFTIAESTEDIRVVIEK